MIIRGLVAAAVFIVLGCSRPPQGLPSHDASTITQIELDESGMPTVYDAIRKLRPNFLNYQPPTSIQNPSPRQPEVYLNETHVGDLSTLQQFQTSQIGFVKFYKSAEAIIKYGTNRAGGVIALTTRQ